MSGYTVIVYDRLAKNVSVESYGNEVAAIRATRVYVGDAVTGWVKIIRNSDGDIYYEVDGDSVREKSW